MFLWRLDAAAPASAPRLPSKAGQHFIALGEATGHFHTVVDSGCDLLDATASNLHTLDDLLKDWSAYDGRLLEVHSRSTVVHQEHGALVLEPGLYAIGRVREWDYTAHEHRRVAD